jgi:hypothetical protein
MTPNVPGKTPSREAGRSDHNYFFRELQLRLSTKGASCFWLLAAVRLFIALILFIKTKTQ